MDLSVLELPPWREVGIALDRPSQLTSERIEVTAINGSRMFGRAVGMHSVPGGSYPAAKAGLDLRIR
jgi:hypothetical protein